MKNNTELSEQYCNKCGPKAMRTFETFHQLKGDWKIDI